MRVGKNDTCSNGLQIHLVYRTRSTSGPMVSTQSFAPRKIRASWFLENIYSTLLIRLSFMQLRYNKVLKLIAILLFSFELLAPAAFSSTENGNSTAITDTTKYSTLSHSLDFLSHLIFEESGSEEEREAKHTLNSLVFTEVFSELQKFEPLNVTWSSPIERFDTQPALFRLHRVLII